MSQLDQIRNAVKDRHATLESVPGSGWHPNDPSSPAKQLQMPLAQRPVLIHGEFDSHFAQQDFAQVQQALAKTAALKQSGNFQHLEPSEKKVINVAGDYAAQDPEADGSLKIRNVQLNDVLRALEMQGVLACATGLEG